MAISKVIFFTASESGQTLESTNDGQGTSSDTAAGGEPTDSIQANSLKCDEYVIRKCRGIYDHKVIFI